MSSDKNQGRVDGPPASSVPAAEEADPAKEAAAYEEAAKEAVDAALASIEADKAFATLGSDATKEAVKKAFDAKEAAEKAFKKADAAEEAAEEAAKEAAEKSDAAKKAYEEAVKKVDAAKEALPSGDFHMSMPGLSPTHGYGVPAKPPNPDEPKSVT
ncbi:colicin import membrane protein [Streptomyces yunnanensis]|uniref:Colicin import membrane protein n=2 Tax=Streptomyces yunnanensis TaxID=156453 RepID=A0A9X8N9A6_9ACTN|nr:colicin import membrane protein [Streptomyces yunnanensis]